VRDTKCLNVKIKAGILCFLPSGHVAHFKTTFLKDYSIPYILGLFHFPKSLGFCVKLIFELYGLMIRIAFSTAGNVNLESVKMKGNCLARRLIIGVRFVGLRETGVVNSLERRFLTISSQLRIR